MLVGLALVIVLVALAVSLGHTSALEQRMARNTLLANQTRQAAQSGLDYGLAWLKQQRPEWLTATNGRDVAAPDRNPPPITNSNGETFAINLTFERAAEWRGFIFVQASASPASAPEIEARVSQFARPIGVLTANGEDAPPLIVDGCADLTQANDVYPRAADTPGVTGPAVASSSNADCIDVGSTNLHGGAVRGESFAPGELWDHLMAVSREEFQTLAAEHGSSGDYHWATAADLNAGNWRRSLGRPERPVVLIIPTELGCPRFSGGARIVGLIMVEADCGGAPSWGDVQIFGSLAIGGGFDALGPSSRLYHISLAPAGPDTLEPPPLDVVVRAGGWRDF